jgi:hypothetical protein
MQLSLATLCFVLFSLCLQERKKKKKKDNKKEDMVQGTEKAPCHIQTSGYLNKNNKSVLLYSDDRY